MEEHDKATRQTDFERLLVNVLERAEQGQVVDRKQLQQEFPQHALAIVEYLDARDQFDAILRGGRDDTSRQLFSQMATRFELDSNSMSNQFGSLGRLTDAQFPIQFGSYLLLAEINRGGMGIVFKARQEKPNRVVALKVMRAAELASDDEVRRFRAEAESLASIVHPNIVPIFEVGEVCGLLYFTMALVQGESLGALTSEQPLNVRDAVRIVSKVAQAISTAHQFGVVHRDLKPSNILLDENQEPFVIDFGLAKQKHSVEAITGTGQILGTPAYMSPEQAKGRGTTMSPAADIYALGAVLYTLVTGQPPFSGPTPFDILLQVIDREPPTPRQLNNSIPRDLECIVLRAMEKEVPQRYASAEELLADLQRFQLGEPIARRRSTIADRVLTWWRREPVLATHLSGIAAVLLTVLVSSITRGESTMHAATIIGLLCVWGVGSIVFQRLASSKRMQEKAYLTWAIFDVAVFTSLIYFANPSRGLLFIGYPAMIAASGLFFRTRFVLLMTSTCVAGFVTLWLTVDDPCMDRLDFCVIFVAGLIVLGLALLAMIRRIRGLNDYFSEQRQC